MRLLKVKITTWSLLAAVLGALLAMPALAETRVSVTIDPVDNRSGPIIVRVYNSNKNWLKNELMTQTVELAESDESAVTFELDMPPGTYAIHIFQDLDNNNKMKTNFIGIPKEPTGVSNDAKGRFGPPKFKDAAFEVGDSALSLSIRLTSI